MFPFVVSPDIQDHRLFLPNMGKEVVCETKVFKADARLSFPINPSISSDDVFGSLIDIHSKISNVIYEASINEYPLPKLKTSQTAISVCNFLSTKKIDHTIHSLSEGGIGFEFTIDSSYYNIKVENDGISTFYKEMQDSIPEGWDLSFDNLLLKLKREF